MKIQDRSYSTKIFRPKPYIHTEDDGSLIVVATSWGQPEHARRAAEEVIKYVSAAKSDVEVTSPFEFLTCLSDEVNYVRTGLMIANDVLYRSENRTEYFAGVELLAIFKRGSQIAWAQVGCPHVLMSRRQQSLQPLSVTGDLSAELSSEGEILPPLPAQLLGLDPTCYVQCGHTYVSEQDYLILLACTSISSSLWSNSSNKIELASVAQKLIQHSPEAPFWMALIDLADSGF